MASVDSLGIHSHSQAAKKLGGIDSNALPHAAKKPRGKTVGAQNSQKKEKRRRKKGKESYRNYSNYIYKVLKSPGVHPDCSISKQAMSIMNSFVLDIIERIARESGILIKINEKSTISGQTIQCATKFVLHDGLLEKANEKGIIAVKKYANATGRKILFC